MANHRLIVGPAIRSVQDLKGKKVAADKLTSHAGLNFWLFLKQAGLDMDRGGQPSTLAAGCGVADRTDRTIAIGWGKLSRGAQSSTAD